jgi:hypothetical protein
MIQPKKNLLYFFGALGGIAFGSYAIATSAHVILQVLGGLGGAFSTKKIIQTKTSQIKNWIKFDPNTLNHNIQELFKKSIHDALDNINVLFKATTAKKDEKKEAAQLIKTLQQGLPKMFSDNNKFQLDESKIRDFLYEKDKEDRICDCIRNECENFEIKEPFKSFLAQNLYAQIQLCFGEGLKDPANQNAWIAFQRMLIEEIRNDIKQIADTQQSIKDDLSDLKFEKSGFSEEQIAEIREFIDLLNNKKLIEVKIRKGVDENLKTIECKANEIIKITTQTKITVEKLKELVEELNRHHRINQILIYSLSAIMIALGVFVAYTLINQPFTAKIKVHGWKGVNHIPLQNGTIILTFGDQSVPEKINPDGIVAFTKIPPKYKNRRVPIPIHLELPENSILFYLTDSVIYVKGKNEMNNIEVSVRGIDRFHGIITDFDTGIGLEDVTIRIADTIIKTDELGYFSIEIPKIKQKFKQKVQISKQGYESWFENEYWMGDNDDCRKTLKKLNTK